MPAQLDRAVELRRGGRLPEALALFEQAVRAQPDSPRAYAGYAFTLAQAGRIDEAIVNYRAAVGLRDPYPTAWAALADAYLQVGDAAGALDAWERPGAQETSSYLFHLNYDANRTPDTIYQAHTAWGRRTAAPQPIPHRNDTAPDRPLKIGYVSAFLCGQVRYSFFDPLFSKDATFYDNTPDPDPYTSRLPRPGNWRSIRGLSDRQAAALIRQDAIDILVDLNGHTAGNRLSLFALKPAPVQVSYLGYPNTTGLPAIDYRLTDSIADPPSTDALHTEEVVRLPRCFLAHAPFPGTGAVSGSPAVSSGAVTFGSFSNPLKWNDAVLDAWSAILNRLPRSRLILHHGACGEAARTWVLNKFAARGVRAERIRLLGFLDPPAHFRLYQEIDLLLDPFPYNGTTAVCEGLWMGVPSVAVTGRTHVARVATSILSTVGLERFTASSIEEYEELAVAIAGDIASLAALRPTLRECILRSPLMDCRGLAAVLEAAYRAMWQRWCAADASRDCQGAVFTSTRPRPQAQGSVQKSSALLSGNFPRKLLHPRVPRAPARLI